MSKESKKTELSGHASPIIIDQYRKILDLLTEGIQIIDFNWCYLYVNDTMADYYNATKEELLGLSLLEKFPGLDQTEMFSVLQKCMTDRIPQMTETAFNYPDQPSRWYRLRIEPVDDGILVISLDITKRREADEKTNRANHLYAFISQVNQNIVKVNNQWTLFRNACQMAIEFGKFKMAWIGLFDKENTTIALVDQSGMPSEDIKSFSLASFQEKGPQAHVIRSGSYYICNDVERDYELEEWKPYARKHGIQSCMVLPIKKSGIIIGTFNLYARELNFSGKEEIDLLVELTSDISLGLDRFEKEKKHRVTEQLIDRNEKQFRHTLDKMLEGIQIHDFNWRYIYVNNSLVNYSTYSREELLSFTLMEKYPGVERTPLFKAMQRCMHLRVAEHLETEFVFPNGSKAYFELSIQPIPEGIFILSVDRSEQKKAKEKLLKANRLYAFISAINKSIVHINNEQELLDNACNVAVEIGQFKMALVDVVDEQRGKLNMVSLRGTEAIVAQAQKHSGMDINNPALKDTTTIKALNTGRYAICEDAQNDPAMLPWKKELVENEIKTCISLPIIKSGKTIGVFSLHSSTENFFDDEEIALLEEATGDISFALELFEKAKKHTETEELVIENELRFRALIEKSADMITLVTAQGDLLYSSPSIKKTLGYTADELLHKHDRDFIHPDDFPSFMQLIAEIRETPGGSFSNEQRVRHKNGEWVWCEGTVTNLLHQPGVMAIVSNFRDISEKRSMEQEREFDKNNLTALINNTKDLMWSVDRDFNLISSNQPLNELLLLITGKEVEKRKNVLDLATSVEQANRFKNYYERAFAGEIFSEIEFNETPTEFWSEISYYPIRQGHDVIGTACHSRDITRQKLSEQHLLKSEAFNRGVLNSLTSHIAVVDLPGNIVAVNESWKQYALENGETFMQRVAVGSNYYDVCRKSAETGDASAAEVLTGMQEVMAGKREVYYLEYECHSPGKQRWFAMRVMKFDNNDPLIVVAHMDISELKIAQEERDNTLHELEYRVETRTKELVEKNTNILDSINYAKNIQTGLLSRPTQLFDIFPKAFILSMPRDIVSGDFFWCYQRRNKKFIVLADCTGHGVPAALLSIIGNNLLNHIVIDEHIENPSEILELLDIRLAEAVKGDTQEVKDGMDMAMCVIDTSFNELYFAGAYRPLFISDEDRNIKNIPSDHHSIGGGTQEMGKKFDTRRFPIVPGQRIYLSSDGYSSQFGGPKGKKFMKSRLIQTLRKIQFQPIENQKELLQNVLAEWAGQNEQVDDIMILGIEL